MSIFVAIVTCLFFFNAFGATNGVFQGEDRVTEALVASGFGIWGLFLLFL